MIFSDLKRDNNSNRNQKSRFANNEKSLRQQLFQLLDQNFCYTRQHLYEWFDANTKNKKRVIRAYWNQYFKYPHPNQLKRLENKNSPLDDELHKIAFITSLYKK